MKKILTFMLLFCMSFSLASCNDDEQKVTVTNDKGEKVEVVLTPTEDKETVKNAVLYASQANYDAIDGMSVTASGNVEMVFNETHSLAFSGSLGLTGTNEGFNGNVDFKANVKGVESEEGLKNESLGLNGNLYFEKDDPYIYLDGKVEQNGTSENQKGKLSIEEFVSGIIGIPSSPAPQKAASNGSTTVAVDQMLEMLYTFMPNSSLVISEVNKELYVLKLDLSLKDFFSISGLSSEITIEKDILFTINLAFNISNGYLREVAFENSNKLFLKYVDSEMYDENSAKFNASLKLELNYGKQEFKKLTAEEKALYPDLTEKPNQTN